MTLSTETGSDLSWRKEGRRGCVSGLSSQLLRGQTTKPAPRASIPKSEPCVTLHFPSLAKSFLGQRSTAHGEGGFGSVSHHSRVPCWGHLAEGTWHLPRAPGEEWQAKALACEKPAESTASSGGASKQTATGGLPSSCWAALVTKAPRAKNH